MMATIRQMGKGDQGRLWHWLHLALWDPPPAPLRPLQVLRNPNVSIYAAGWGKPGDVGVVAMNREVDAGACWIRLLSSGLGLAYVDDFTPQLGIAVEPGHRRQGLGTLLMRSVLTAAGSHGYSRISLTVHPENPSIPLYRAHGFRFRGLRRSYHLMVADLETPGA